MGQVIGMSAISVFLLILFCLAGMHWLLAWVLAAFSPVFVAFLAEIVRRP